MMKRRDFLATSLTSMAAFSSLSRLSHATPAASALCPPESWMSDHLYLQGINAPIAEEVELEQLTVTGEIPADLRGMYIRNGPNPKFQPIAYSYPLHGDGMLHAIYFEESQVRYRNRWIKTSGLLKEMAAGQALPEINHNYANTNIISHAGVLLALYETGLPHQVTTALETLGEWTFHGKLEHSMSAHPRLDPLTQELHFHRYSFGSEPYLIYYKANINGDIISQTPVELPHPTLLHDMALTKHYAIVFHCPVRLNLQQAREGKLPFSWHPEQGTRMGLIHRQQPENPPLWFEMESVWLWHFVNAYECQQRVVIDYVRHPQIRLSDRLEDILSHQSKLHRVVLDLNAQTVEDISLDDRSVELPTIHPARLGQPYQFAYMPHIDLEQIAEKGIPNYFPELIQYDLIHQTSRVHRLPSGCYAGEAIVVPKANSTNESDSYVLSWVFDENRQASDLIILDAAQFDQTPIAQIHLPVRVPFGFHGSWLPTLLY